MLILLQKYSINMWLEGGAQAEKLLIGTPMYGRTYRLKYNNQNTLGAPIDGPGDAGRYSGEAGFLAYYEICSDNSWGKVWNVTNSVLYAYKNYQWVSYDDCNTIAVKIQWAVEHNLGGVMIWSLESDDFNGICGGEKYPLLKSINRGLGRLS
ncbi:Acidic mammalian chitinase [Blattella germanica]|nr:Acidic mammalian chitinase [Blattella germanica]